MTIEITLTRDDLQRDKKDEPLHRINFFCFSTRLNRDDINRASKITFVDGEYSKTLKSSH